MTQAAAEGTLEGVILPHKNAINKKSVSTWNRTNGPCHCHNGKLVIWKKDALFLSTIHARGQNVDLWKGGKLVLGHYELLRRVEVRS